MLIIFSFIFGLFWGSFLNVLIYRLPLGKLPSGRSKCPHCNHTLEVLDLIPLFSFIFLGGRCRYCKEKVSWRYPAVEIITGLLFALSALIFIPHNLVTGLIFAKVLFFVTVCVVIFGIDASHYKILTKVVYPAAILVLLLNISIDLLAHTLAFNLASHTVSGVLAGSLGFLIFYSLWFISRGRWIGDGDFRLMWLLGFGLGLSSFITGLYLGIIFGGVCALALMIFGGAKLKDKLPFAIFLIPGALVALFWGPPIASYYLSLIGWA